MPKPKIATSAMPATAVMTVSHCACTFSSTVAGCAMVCPVGVVSARVSDTLPFATDCTGTVVRVEESLWTLTTMSLRTTRSAEFDGWTESRTVTGYIDSLRIEIGRDDRSPSSVRLLESVIVTESVVRAQAATRFVIAASRASSSVRQEFEARARSWSRAGAVTSSGVSSAVAKPDRASEARTSRSRRSMRASPSDALVNVSEPGVADAVDDRSVGAAHGVLSSASRAWDSRVESDGQSRPRVRRTGDVAVPARAALASVAVSSDIAVSQVRWSDAVAAWRRSDDIAWSATSTLSEPMRSDAGMVVSAPAEVFPLATIVVVVPASRSAGRSPWATVPSTGHATSSIE